MRAVSIIFLTKMKLFTWPSSSNAITTTAAPNFLTIVALWIKSSSPSFNEIELTIHFPWLHFNPASITLKLDESMHKGTYSLKKMVVYLYYTPEIRIEFLPWIYQAPRKLNSEIESLLLRHLTYLHPYSGKLKFDVSKVFFKTTVAYET